MLLDIIGNREIWVTGKGGIGKTTTTSALALHYARQKEWVLAFDIDGYHSMPDALDAEPQKGCRFRIPENIVYTLFDDAQYNEIKVDLDVCLVSPRKIVEQVKAGRETNRANRAEGLPEYFGILHMYDVLDQLGVLTASNDLAALCLIAAERQRRLNMPSVKNQEIQARFVYDNQSSNATIDLLDRALNTVDRLKNMKEHNLEWRMKTTIAGWKDMNAFVKDDYIRHIERYIEEFSALNAVVKDPAKTFYLVVSGTGRSTEIQETERLVQELKESGFPVGAILFNKVNAATIRNIERFRDGMFQVPVYIAPQLDIFEREKDVRVCLGEFVSAIKPLSSE